MKYIIKTQQGDISVIITILISTILFLLLIPLSQKITSESRISKNNLRSEQAIQAANTGLEAWKYNYSLDSAKIDPGSILGQQNWPNINTETLIDTVNTDSSGKKWVVLNNVNGISTEYRVTYQAGNPSTGVRESIISTGKSVQGNIIIERTLEQKF